MNILLLQSFVVLFQNNLIISFQFCFKTIVYAILALMYKSFMKKCKIRNFLYFESNSLKRYNCFCSSCRGQSKVSHCCFNLVSHYIFIRQSFCQLNNSCISEILERKFTCKRYLLKLSIWYRHINEIKSKI